MSELTRPIDPKDEAMKAGNEFFNILRSLSPSLQQDLVFRFLDDYRLHRAELYKSSEQQKHESEEYERLMANHLSEINIMFEALNPQKGDVT